jgi:hypothetical protein
VLHYSLSLAVKQHHRPTLNNTNIITWHTLAPKVLDVILKLYVDRAEDAAQSTYSVFPLFSNKIMDLQLQANSWNDALFIHDGSVVIINKITYS